jgi:type II secretory pathway component GspD/PulD (secretin)
MRTAWILAVVLAAGCAAPPPTPEPRTSVAVLAPPRSLDATLETLDVEDADLRAVVGLIAGDCGTRIDVAPDIHETVTISLHDIAGGAALELIAKMTKCNLVHWDDRIAVVRVPRVTIQIDDADVGTVLHLLFAYSGKNAIVSPLIRGDYTGPEIRDMTVAEALTAIAGSAHAWWLEVGDTVYVGPLPAHRDPGIAPVSPRAR